MAHLDIEFTGRITATDDEIKAAIKRALSVFASAGITPEQAAMDNAACIEDRAEQASLWSSADFAATEEMGEGAMLVWK